MYQCDKCFHQYCVSNDSLASCNVCEDGDMFLPIEESEEKNMNEVRCPYCGAVIEFDDEFANFDDQGDCIVASATYICDCGESVTVKATFVWDGELEVD